MSWPRSKQARTRKVIQSRIGVGRKSPTPASIPSTTRLSPCLLQGPHASQEDQRRDDRLQRVEWRAYQRHCPRNDSDDDLRAAEHAHLPLTPCHLHSPPDPL